METKKGNYKCSHCDAVFSKEDRLTSHEFKHTGIRPYECDVPGCNKTYTNKAHLKRHKCLSHGPKENRESEGIQCTQCGQVLSNKYAFKKHCKNIHECQKYTCTYCPNEFQKKRNLQEHLTTHTGESIYKCEECNIGFGKNHLYKKHLRRHKTYECACGEKFGRWMLLTQHRRTNCSKRKVSECPICSKTFSSETILKQHSLQVHLPESQKKVHKCTYPDCTRSYFYKKNLKWHINYFHKKIGRENVCPLCKKVLKSKTTLKNHIKSEHGNLPKVIKPRKTRKDKGTKKKCMASILTGVQIPIKEHLEIITTEQTNSDFIDKTGKAPIEISDKKQLVQYKRSRLGYIKRVTTMVYGDEICAEENKNKMNNCNLSRINDDKSQYENPRIIAVGTGKNTIVNVDIPFTENVEFVNVANVNITEAKWDNLKNEILVDICKESGVIW